MLAERASMVIRMPPLHASQRAVAESAARFRVLACGRRWGKTLLGVALCIESAARGGRAWWVAPTYKLATVGWRELKRLALQIPYTRVTDGDFTVRLASGGTVQVRSADNPDSLRGDGLDFVVLDECAFIAEEAWIEALRPALSDRRGRALFISTPQGRNWFWRAWQRGLGSDAEWQSWQLPTADNPHIDPAEIEAARQSLPERVFNQEYLADFLHNEGVFFPEWAEAKHVIPARGDFAHWARWIAIDWGFADPLAVLWLCRAPDHRRIYVYRELYVRGLRDEQQAQRILSMTGDERILGWYGDPSMFNQRRESNRPSIASIYRAAGIPLRPAANSRIPGWQAVRRALAGDEPRLQVISTCHNLIRTLPEQVHDPIHAEDLADKIDGRKTEDHAVDALRYGLMAEAQPARVAHQRPMAVPVSAKPRPKPFARAS